jgi:hypothetical protein
MLHFSCDLCGRHLSDQRFVIKLEVFPAFDPEEISEDDLDVDHLQEVSESLQEAEATGQFPVVECGPKEFRFDLCETCHGSYVKDPLGRNGLRRLNFSEN